jgi:hypothetical protein
VKHADRYRYRHPDDGADRVGVRDNRAVGNDSGGIAVLANCVADNVFASSVPTGLKVLFPCGA